MTVQRFRLRIVLYAVGSLALMLPLTGCDEGDELFNPLFWQCKSGSQAACDVYKNNRTTIVPVAGIDLTVRAGDNEVLLSWPGNTGAGDLVVYRADRPGARYDQLVVVTSANQTCVVDRRVQNEHQYRYEVKSRDGQHDSGVVKATPRAGLPALHPDTGCAFVGAWRSLSGGAAATPAGLSVRLRGRVARRGNVSRAAGKLIGTGYRLSGTMTAKLVQPGRSRVLPRSTWRARLDFVVDPRTRKATVKGTVLVSGTIGKLCLAYSSSALPGVAGTTKHALRGTFSVLGATGQSATVFPRGSYDAEQINAASWNLIARGSIASAKPKRLPPRCTALGK